MEPLFGNDMVTFLLPCLEAPRVVCRSFIPQLKMQWSCDSLTWAVCSQWLALAVRRGRAMVNSGEDRPFLLLGAAGLAEGEMAGKTTGYSTVPGWSWRGGSGWTDSHISGETNTKTLWRTGGDQAGLATTPKPLHWLPARTPYKNMWDLWINILISPLTTFTLLFLQS